MRRSRSLAPLLFAILLSSCGGVGSGNPKARIAEIERLFPLFEAYRLVAFRNEEWCKALEYPRGRFASNSGSTCTAILSGHRRPFDNAARRDQAAINQAIRDTCNALRSITAVRFTEEGKLNYGVFDCREGERGLLFVFSTAPLGSEPSFEGTALEPVMANWWAGR